MRLYLFILLSITGVFASSIKTITIDNRPFTVLKEHYNEYGVKGDYITLYSGAEENRTSKLLNFVLSEVSGSCSDRSIEQGSYEVNGSTITLCTRWRRQGAVNDTPKGARVQVYQLLKDNSLKELSNKFYIETSSQGSDPESGMKYLFTPPKTEEEKKALKAYVTEVERAYHGTFVFGDEAKKLMRDVKEALRRKRKAAWGWKR